MLANGGSVEVVERIGLHQIEAGLLCVCGEIASLGQGKRRLMDSVIVKGPIPV